MEEKIVSGIFLKKTSATVQVYDFRDSRGERRYVIDENDKRRFSMEQVKSAIEKKYYN